VEKGNIIPDLCIIPPSSLKFLTSFSKEILLCDVLDLLVLLKMPRGDVLCVKRARLLSRNEIREIVMNSDSDEDKHYAFQESEDEEEPCPPS
jgi:hypothetical protein